jgi:hypothetical protein
VCRRFPEAFERVASGDLHLSALCALSPQLNPANASELFAACCRKSRRQIEELIAARFPRPDVREQIRRLPVRAHDAPPTRGEAPRHREFEPLSVDRFGVHFTADAGLRELIERAQALASHRLPKGDLASLMKLVFGTFVRHEEKRRFAVGRKPRAARGEEKAAGSAETALARTSAQPTGTASTPPSVAKRSFDAARWHAIHSARRSFGSAQRRATHSARRSASAARVAASQAHAARALLANQEAESLPSRFGDSLGVPAGSGAVLVRVGGRSALSVAGVLAARSRRALGGAGGFGSRNVRLLCRGHNLLHARHCFGAKRVAAKIAARRAVARRIS